MSSKHLLYSVIFLAAILLRTSPVLAQPLELKVTSFDEDKGLNSRIIRAMMQDSSGYFWAGTVDGLSRFDGYTFKTFRNDPANPNSMAGNSVTALAEDLNHHIWIGLQRGGISSYDPVTGKFRNYDLRVGDVSLSSLPITMIYVDEDNEIWAGVQTKGLVHLDKNTGKPDLYDIIPPSDTYYTPDQRLIYNQVYKIISDGKQAFWMATHDGLYRFDKQHKKMTAVREKPLQKNAFRRDLFGSIMRDSVTLWMGSWAGGLTSYNTVTREWHNYLMDTIQKEKSTVNIISGMAAKGKSMIWITSNDRGLGMFNKTFGKFFFFGGDASHMTVALPDDLCYGLMQDREGGVWVSSEKGLLRIQMHAKKFPFLEVPVSHSDNGDYYEVTGVIDDGGYQLTGTVYGDGLQVMNKETGTVKAIPFELLAGEEKFLLLTDMMRDSKGNVWVLTRDYIYNYESASQRLIKTAQPPLLAGNRSNYFNKMIEDDKGNMWFATHRNGVLRYNTLTKEFTVFNANAAAGRAIASNSISSIAKDKKGRIWIGSPRGCLAYLDSAKDQFIPINSVKDKNGNIDNQVHSLAADSKGNIWAGTEAGLLKFDATAVTPAFIRMYTAADGLRADLARSVCEDAYGKIWCITPSALCMLDPATGNISSFGIPDGLRYSSIGERLMQAPDKKMMIVAWKGYHVFDPASLQVKRSTADLAITSFTSNGREKHIEEQLQKNGRIRLAADENLFSFEFAAIDFNEASRQQYAYMLEGVDKDWVQAGNRRYANYSNLPGGDYTFKVRATNIPGEWDGKELSIPIHIATRFYKTWWFRIGFLLLIVGGLIFLYRSRIQQKEKVHRLQNKANSLEKEKAQVMYENLKQQLNPHFLFNSLTSLSSLIRINSKMASEFLEGLSKTYRYILKSRDNETVPLTNELKFAETYVKLQQTRFEKGLIVNFNVPEEFFHRKIAPVTLQNMIENAIKHNIIDEENPLVIDIFTGDDSIIIRNNLQLKNFVETSNKTGLINLQTLYRYLSDRPVEIKEDQQFFTVKIPLL